MVICGSYMFEFGIDKDMKSMLHMRRGGNRKNSGGTFMSNTNCQGIKN